MYLYAVSIFVLFYLQTFACCQRRRVDMSVDLHDGCEEQTTLKDDNKGS